MSSLPAFLYVTKIGEYQHYPDRARPPWMKLHRDIWTSPTLVELSPATKLLAIFLISYQSEFVAQPDKGHPLLAERQARNQLAFRTQMSHRLGTDSSQISSRNISSVVTFRAFPTRVTTIARRSFLSPGCVRKAVETLLAVGYLDGDDDEAVLAERFRYVLAPLASTRARARASREQQQYLKDSLSPSTEASDAGQNGSGPAAAESETEPPRESRIRELVEGLPGSDRGSVREIEPLALQLPAVAFEATVARVAARRAANPVGLLVKLLRDEVTERQRTAQARTTVATSTQIENERTMFPESYIVRVRRDMTAEELDAYLDDVPFEKQELVRSLWLEAHPEMAA